MPTNNRRTPDHWARQKFKASNASAERHCQATVNTMSIESRMSNQVQLSIHDVLALFVTITVAATSKHQDQISHNYTSMHHRCGKMPQLLQGVLFTFPQLCALTVAAKASWRTTRNSDIKDKNKNLTSTKTLFIV